MKRLLSAILLSGLIFGHTLWINSTAFYGKINERTVIFLGWGHRFPVADFINPEDVKDYGVILPDGRRVKFNPGGGFLETPFQFKQEGYYIVYASTKSGYYTMALKGGEIHHYSKPMDEVEGRILVSSFYQQFAKAILKSGNPSRGFDRAVGFKMELIPLEDPSGLKSGDFIRLRVLFRGRPLPFVPVYATYEGFSTRDDYAFATETDEKGIAEIRILHWGRWMVKAQLKKNPQGRMAKKCRVLSFTSTLSFEVK